MEYPHPAAPTDISYFSVLSIYLECFHGSCNIPDLFIILYDRSIYGEYRELTKRGPEVQDSSSYPLQVPGHSYDYLFVYSPLSVLLLFVFWGFRKGDWVVLRLSEGKRQTKTWIVTTITIWMVGDKLKHKPTDGKEWSDPLEIKLIIQYK